MGSPTSETRRYRVHEVLGKGGFGTVYRAELIASGGFSKPVALKVLNADVTGADEMLQRLRDEARMLGLLRHRAIVQVDGLVELDGRWTIVMEYVEGASLRHVLDRGEPIPPGVALEIVEEVAGALNVAYEKPTRAGKALRLLHRDIKPSNIQLTPAGEVKLLDFGVARADFGSREAKTRSLIFGSIKYMAPERLDFEDTHAGDVYALGITLYEMLTAQALEKASVNPKRHAKRVEAALAELDAATRNKELTALVGRTLAYEPTARPNARELERAARSLRAAYPEPWLKDWSETAVTPLLHERPSVSDELTGSLLIERSDVLASGQIKVGSVPPAASPVQPSEPTTSLDQFDDDVEEEPPPLPSFAHNKPQPRPKPSVDSDPWPKPPKRRRRRWWPVLLGLGIPLGLVASAVLVVVLVLGIGTFGTAWALVQSGIWGDAMAQTADDDFREMEAKLQGLKDGPNKDAMIALVQRGRQDAWTGRIGFMEMVNFSVAFDNAMMDGVLDDLEVERLTKQYETMAKN